MTETPENTPESKEELVDAPVTEGELEEEGADSDVGNGSDDGNGGSYEPADDDGDIEPISIEEEMKTSYLD